MRPAGLEPATPGLEGRCSIQLSYGRLTHIVLPGRNQLPAPCEDPDVRILVALIAFVLIGALAGANSRLWTDETLMPNTRVAVLVELFTSEGCSSCPPADALLRELIATQPVPGVLIVGLSEHVDYWNRLGWTDPFSDRVFSARQSAYAAFARSDNVYTPQMVVDGRASFVGSDRARALKEIAAAATQFKPAMELRWIDNGDLDVRLASGSVKAGTPVWVAIAEHGLTVKVPRGENADRTLTHDAVTRRLSQAGRADQSGAFRQFVPIRLAGAWHADATAVTVFAQETGGPIAALATIKVADRETK